jgi:membrane-bound inhibitor of C-type lysozyme
MMRSSATPMTRRCVPDLRLAGLLAPALAACATVPVAAPGELEQGAARYRCDDGTLFTARFDREGGPATLTFEQPDPSTGAPDAIDRDFRVVLEPQPVGSGMWYAGGGWSLRGKGPDATLTRPDGRMATCRAGGPAGTPATI